MAPPARLYTWLRRSWLAGTSGMLAACADHQAPTALQSSSTKIEMLAPALRLGVVAQPDLIRERLAQRVARQVPTFAGIYVENGRLMIGTTDLSRESEARSVVATELADDPHRELPVQTIKMRYSFAQLDQWEAAIRAEAPNLGLLLSGVSDRENIVRAGVLSSAQQNAAYVTAARLGMPHDAFAVDVVRFEMKIRELLRILQADGWVLVRTRGSHRQFKHATKLGLVTVAGHEGDDIAKGTLNSVLKQAGLKP